MSAYASITAAGFAATAVTYGPARMGFGLFLSRFRDAFDVSAGTAGLISALGFAGFLASLPVAYNLMARTGPRLPVMIALICATAGAALIALAQGPLMLAAGAVLAMSSAGFSWSPFNGAVNHHLSEAARPGALSIVSTGTSLGVAAAGLTALAISVSGLGWRIGWSAFAGAGAVAAALALVLLRTIESGPRARPGSRRLMLHSSAVPLYLVAFAFGAASTIYISFVANAVEQDGGVLGLPSGASSGVLFAVYGVAGLAGLATGRIGERLGLALLLRVLFLACAVSFALIAAWPGSLAAVALSAALQGAFVMMISATLAFWSERLYPGLPAMSFTCALIAVAAGSVAGPLAAGYAADLVGFPAMLAAAGAASLLAAIAVRKRRLNDPLKPVGAPY